MENRGSGLALIGETIDRYRLERLLGEGGFGAVYVARHTVTDRHVALKVLHADRAETRETVARFLQEAKAAAAIGNPHIIEVLDAGASGDGKYFLAMELLEGHDLDTLIAREGPLSLERAADLTTQILEALGAAHDKGIVHRDLKPANVFITRDRQGREFAKLLDFGISKMRGPEKLGTLTEAGMVLGTPQYMAPEQSVASQEIDGRADLWSASVLLYEMLSGRLPFEADTYQRLLLKIHTEPPVPLSVVAPQLPPLFTAVVERGLARDPDARWPSASAMAEGLGKAMRGDPSALGAVNPTSRVVGHLGYGLAVTPIGPSLTTGPIAPTVGVPSAFPASAGMTPASMAQAGTTAPHGGVSGPVAFAPTGLAPSSGGHGGYPHAIHTPGPHPSPLSPEAPKPSSGVGLLFLGCGAVLVLGLVVGAAGLLAYLGSDSLSTPPSVPPPTAPIATPTILPTGEDSALADGHTEESAADLIPLEPAHVLMRRKLDPYRSACLDRYAERAASSRARYLSWADEQQGPRQRGRHVYGVYTVNGDGRDCQQAVAEANVAEPDHPELEALATEFAAAIVELAPLLVEAERYYDQGDWQDDNMAEGDRMHRPLMRAFDRFQAASESLSARVRTLEGEVDAALLSGLTADSAEPRRMWIERVRVEARSVRDLAIRIRVVDRRYTGVTESELTARVDALEQAIEGLRGYAATQPGDDALGSYAESADDVLGPAKALRRAVASGARLDGTHASWVGTSAGWMVEGSPDAYEHAYQHFLTFGYSSAYD